jgi:hypothetical protein
MNYSRNVGNVVQSNVASTRSMTAIERLLGQGRIVAVLAGGRSVKWLDHCSPYFVHRKPFPTTHCALAVRLKHADITHSLFATEERLGRREIPSAGRKPVLKRSRRTTTS